MIDNYYDTITSELVAEFGEDILSKNNPQPEISIKRAYELLNEMGFENAQAYIKAGGR